jgi:hypothetical protein
LPELLLLLELLLMRALLLFLDQLDLLDLLDQLDLLDLLDQLDFLLPWLLDLLLFLEQLRLDPLRSLPFPCLLCLLHEFILHEFYLLYDSSPAAECLPLWLRCLPQDFNLLEELLL